MDFFKKVKAYIKGKPVYDIKKAIDEKRYSPRIRCFIETKCTFQDKKERVLIVNEVSMTGLRLYCEDRLKPGDVLTLEVNKPNEIFYLNEKMGQKVDARVIWSKKKKSTQEYVSGLRFDCKQENLKDTWVALLFEKFGITVTVINQQRKRVRFQAEIPLSVSVNALIITGIIVNLGIGGMLIITEKDIRKAPLLRFNIGPYKKLEALVCEGKVVHHQYDMEIRKWSFGILFARLDEKKASLLNEYLTTLYIEEIEPE